MITDQLVTYEVAKLAKEKGFNVQTFDWYDYTGNYCKGFFFPHELHECPRYKEYYAPTQSLLQRWLREEEKYAISVFWDMLSKDYRYEIVKTIGALEIQVGEKYNYSNPNGFDTYELALEDALKYALNMLPSRETSQ